MSAQPEPVVRRHADHDPSLTCRPALGYGLCEVLGDGERGDENTLPVTKPLDLRCPSCGAQPGNPCVARSGRPTTSHKARPGTPGFTGRDERGRQFCLACRRWKFPAIHSCPGVPQ